MINHIGDEPRRVAVIHDWLTTYAGSERVLEQILRIYPSADVYTLVDFLPGKSRGFLAGHRVVPSVLQRLPGIRKWYRAALPLMTFAVEQFDLSEYDLVISSSHAIAKGVITGPDQLHVTYCHSPIRYAWDLQHEYLRESGIGFGPRGLVMRWLLHRVRIWDLRTANGVDHWIANSSYIARRIRKVYRRDAVVIHPPVDVEAFSPAGERDGFYLAVSRMVPYKRMALIAEAFASMPDRHLVMVGDGPDLERVRSLAGPNVQVIGAASPEELRYLMASAKAFVFAAREDFGIAPVEAQAAGCPVIAYGKGGILDTVIPGVTGLFFDDQTTEGIADAIRRFEASAGGFDAGRIRSHAMRFSEERFRSEFSAAIERMWTLHTKGTSSAESR